MIARVLRKKIINKLAQAQKAQTTETTFTLAPPPTIPGDIFAHLNEGYNGGTTALLSGLINYLNTALYYASQGKDSIQRISTNSMDLSGATPDHRNIGMIAKKVFDTFLNKKNPFPKKVLGTVIKQWADTILTMPEYNNLTQIRPTGMIATKLQGNLKTIILDYLNSIKAQNSGIV